MNSSGRSESDVSSPLCYLLLGSQAGAWLRDGKPTLLEIDFEIGFRRMQDEWLQWDGEGEQQTACIRVWDWTHFVSISSSASVETKIECYGFIVDAAKSLEKIQVLSEIKRMIGKPDPSYHGILRLEADAESTAFKMTIGVAEEIFDRLYRVFLDSSPDNSLWINLTVTNPNWSHPRFWKTGWQECDLIISQFELVYKRDVMPSERERYR